MITGVTIIIDGETYKLPAPYRHHHLIKKIHAMTGENVYGKQGFYTDKGIVLDRKEAAKHAVDCGQIDKLNWPPNLFSEDVW